MQTITIKLEDDLLIWANANGKTNLEALIKTALREYMNKLATPFDAAVSAFRTNIHSIAHGMEFEVPQVVGYSQWEKLDRGTRLSFGKFVKANQEAFGVSHVRTTTSNHAVYKRT